MFIIKLFNIVSWLFIVLLLVFIWALFLWSGLSAIAPSVATYSRPSPTASVPRGALWVIRQSHFVQGVSGSIAIIQF